MKRLETAAIGALMIALGTVAANAGCYDYREHPENTPPAATVCINGKCEKATQVVGCANTSGAFIEFSNGWAIVDPKENADPDTKVIDKCTPIDDGGCGM